VEPGRRAQYLFDAARVLRRRRFELAAWQVYECGKPWREADADVAETIDYCEFYGREMLRLAAPRRRDAPAKRTSISTKPAGVTAVIAPWNFPMAILCGMATAALVTGNTVVLKPAEQSCVVGAKLMEVFEEIALPPGVANFLPGVGEEVGPVLVEHPAVAVIAFTGSRAVGLNINRAAAEPRPGQEQVKRVIAEMGGKNAVVVDDDADLDEAVHGVVASAFGYAGQKCSACSRVIVPAGLHDAFLARLVEATRSLKVAPAEDPGCTVGPVIDDEAQARILRTIEQGKSQGRLVYAGDVGALAQEGCFVAPHVFADVDPSAPLATEEIFGPVLTVLRFRRLRPVAGDRQRHGLRPDRRPLLAQPGAHRGGEKTFSRRQPVHQPQDHRRPGGPAAVRRFQDVRRRLQGGRPRLFVAIRPAADYHGKYVAARLRARRRPAPEGGGE